MRRIVALAGLVSLVGCGSADPATTAADASVPIDGATSDVTPADSAPAVSSLGVLGNGQHVLAAVEVTEIASAADGLDQPTDLAFNPRRSNELWITNQGDESIVLVTDPGTPQRKAGKAQTPTGHHFLARPTGLAFGANGNFATIHETDQQTQGPDGTAADFMGPTLWTSDLTIFDGGHTGHIDMLHNSPLGMGIAWETGNAYWVFDGLHGSITRYDFKQDHGPGNTDHSDGEVERYVEGQVKREPGVVSHMELDHDSGLLYVADTGNGRVAVLDTTSGSPGAPVGPNYDSTKQIRVDGARLTILVDESGGGPSRPAGLALHDGHVFVGDNATARVLAFSLDGKLADWLDTELSAGGLMGMSFDGQGRLYLIDAKANRIVRVAAKAN